MPAVVVRPRLLEPLEVRVEVGLREERRAVDPGELRVLLVAAPVRPREPGEPKRLDRRGVLEVRPAAEVGEVALRVERDVAVGGVDELDLVRLPLGLEPRPRLVARRLEALPGPPLLELARDLRLDRLQVGLVDRLGELEVVVEAVVDRRTDRDLHARVQPAHGLGEQVRRRVAQHGERVGIVAVARREDLERRAVRKRQPEVARLAVDPGQHGLLRELRADRAGGVERARPVGELERRAVWKRDVHVTRG